MKLTTLTLAALLSTCATAPAADVTPECKYQQMYTAAIFGALDDAKAYGLDDVVVRYLETDLSVAMEIERWECGYE